MVDFSDNGRIARPRCTVAGLLGASALGNFAVRIGDDVVLRLNRRETARCTSFMFVSLLRSCSSEELKRLACAALGDGGADEYGETQCASPTLLVLAELLRRRGSSFGRVGFLSNFMFSVISISSSLSSGVVIVGFLAFTFDNAEEKATSSFFI